MSYKIVYHGSERIVKEPIYDYKGSNINNDYGKGFYTTDNIEVGKEWANRYTDSGYLNKYNINLTNLKILDLRDKEKYNVLNWIAILLHFKDLDPIIKEVKEEELKWLEKFYIDVEEYDVVIGYRADDAYFKFPILFINNILSLDRLEEIYLNGDLGVQIVLISKKSFERIHYINSVLVDKKYRDKYKLRIETANDRFKTLEIEEAKSKNKKIKDLMKEDVKAI